MPNTTTRSEARVRVAHARAVKAAKSLHLVRLTLCEDEKFGRCVYNQRSMLANSDSYKGILTFRFAAAEQVGLADGSTVYHSRRGAQVKGGRGA
ncbi:hypothetical protein GQ600_9039 [Phytophthora cactorum]|nr:hypothetical protein GQ600_9039 [Phytophthora cactorum]